MSESKRPTVEERLVALEVQARDLNGALLALWVEVQALSKRFEDLEGEFRAAAAILENWGDDG